MEYIVLRENSDQFTDDEQTILLALNARPMVADELVEATRLPAKRVLSTLTLLTIRGLVCEEAGKRYRSQVRVRKEADG